jgi:hypothetical protein
MAQSQTPVRRPDPKQLASVVRQDCETAVRLLNVLIREREDVLLLRAREAVTHAAALSTLQLRRPARVNR